MSTDNSGKSVEDTVNALLGDVQASLDVDLEDLDPETLNERMASAGEAMALQLASIVHKMAGMVEKDVRDVPKGTLYVKSVKKVMELFPNTMPYIRIDYGCKLPETHRYYGVVGTAFSALSHMAPQLLEGVTDDGVEAFVFTLASDEGRGVTVIKASEDGPTGV